MTVYTQLCFNTTSVVDTDLLFTMSYVNGETEDSVTIETGPLKATNGEFKTVNLITDSNIEQLVGLGILKEEVLNGGIKLAERIWLDGFLINRKVECGENGCEEDNCESEGTVTYTEVSLEFTHCDIDFDLVELKILSSIADIRVSLEAVINLVTGNMTYNSTTPFTLKFYEEHE